jgi:hypothetical protein
MACLFYGRDFYAASRYSLLHRCLRSVQRQATDGHGLSCTPILLNLVEKLSSGEELSCAKSRARQPAVAGFSHQRSALNRSCTARHFVRPASQNPSRSPLRRDIGIALAVDQRRVATSIQRRAGTLHAAARARHRYAPQRVPDAEASGARDSVAVRRGGLVCQLRLRARAHW